MNIWALDDHSLRKAAKLLRKENAKYPTHFVLVPPEGYQGVAARSSKPLVAVWRSRDFLVQIYDHGEVLRVSVNRTVVDTVKRRWVDGITWDELQRIKREIGLGEKHACEIFPSEEDTVDVANVRHLWVWKEECPLSFLWRKE